MSGQPGIFILEVGHSLEFDWTWEGAVAFRSSDPNQFTGDIDATDDFVGLPGGGPADGQPGVWAGEVVEVDETNGRLFVSVSSPENRPCCGTFFVRPFEFLSFLHSLFCQPGADDLRRLLPARLNAARGDIHPPTTGGPRSGLEQFEQMWGRSWGVLWGPPGCGKTTNLGRQVAACLGGDERILVVSTTNKATDEAAFAIGRSGSSGLREEGRILRIGKGAAHDAYEARGLTALLRGTETDLLRHISSLARNLERTRHHEDRAVLRRQIQGLLRSMKDSAFNIFVSPDVKVVVATAFKAITLLSDPAVRSLAAAGEAPFTTVLIDEAGLMSRVVVAGMSLLAARRVVVVGDAKQLAPISKVSRVLPTSQAVWLSSSCLTHLQRVQQVRAGVHLLREQHRMHPEISRVVSHFQYEGALLDAVTVTNRQTSLSSLPADCPRAIWYVLDEDGHDLPSIRAERGPGNRSWVRPATQDVLRKLFSIRQVREARGLFITPFRAQAKSIASYFADERQRLQCWSSGTVHAQQGTEADVVVFDTVNAGSCGWPYDEWKRLVNVGLSRAREFVLLLASRAEMNEPYLQPLLGKLSPRILRRSGTKIVLDKVPAHDTFEVSAQISENHELLGNQLARRKSLRPVMSAEQQRLIGLSMDGNPRLVRGIAGSGKTMVLAHWLQKTVQGLASRPDARVWAIYANRSLRRLIADTIEEAWKSDGARGPFPWDRVQLHHVKDILELLLPEVGLRVNGFDYDDMAARYLERKPFEKIGPRCHAMFIDEAQDMGPSLLKLLSALVEPADSSNPKGRAVNIFYDNAQNIYGRTTPRWSDMGLDMRGRSTVMKESFRSTRPITEFALNVLYRLQPPDADPDHKELVERGLVEQTTRGGVPWWNVGFNQVEGPVPIFRRFASLEGQIDALGTLVVRWIREEGVKPGDICILYNGKNIRWRLEQQVAPKLKEMGYGLTVVGEQGWNRSEGAVLASNSHSYKGYDSEVVVLAGVEQFIAKEKGILANNLYVAMTRARSILAVYAYARKNPDANTQLLLSTLQKCMDVVERSRVEVEQEVSNLSDFEDVLGSVGPGHRDWLARLWKTYLIQQEPITATDGEILAEPLFWFQLDDRVVACFGKEEPGPHTMHKLEDSKIAVIRPGQDLPE